LDLFNHAFFHFRCFAIVSTGWTFRNGLTVAGIPAVLYAIQNIAVLSAYQNLDALTFNVLNQTKTLSAAVCCYIVMGSSQSSVQMFALVLLLAAALIIEGVVPLERSLVLDIKAPSSLSPSSWLTSWESRSNHFTLGVFPILLASFLSGLAGALSQRNLQHSGGGRNSYLFSMELCAATIIVLIVSFFFSPDGVQIFQQGGFWRDWTVSAFIPIITNSVGGIIVGLVTKYAGSVRKGFALIFGILISAVIQANLQPNNATITKEQLVGGVLATISLYLHAKYPPYSGLPLDTTQKRD
jgi:solute carrier family 35 (UDP-sugar transporter), member A1/2/3